MRNTIFQPRQTLITADWLNAVDNAIFNSDVTISPTTFGAVGDGVTDDYSSLQALINSLKKPGIVLNIPATADSNLGALPRVSVDLQGKTYKVSKRLDFADLYYVNFRNGKIIADASVTWGNDPVLYIARPQTFDLDKIYRIQFIRFDGVIVDGNYVANCVYLENAFAVTFDGDSVIRRWKDNGYGLRSGPDTSTYVTKCGRLRIGRTHFWQVDLAATGLQTPSGTGIILRSSDFIIDGAKVNACDVACDLDGMTNGQIVALHTFVESSQICLKVGPNASNLAITTFYSDTGLVQFRSFSHTISNGIFTANSQVQFIATQANETMAGFQVQGLFSNQPQYLTEGAGSWSSGCKGFIVGRMTGGSPSNGAKVLGRGGFSLGRQAASLPSLTFNDDTTSDYNTGFYSPAANQWAFSSQGTPKFVIDDTGKIVYGSLSAISSAQASSSQQMHGTNIADASFSVTRWTSTATSQPQYTLARSHSGTIGTFSAVQSGDYLGRYVFGGDTGATLNGIGAAVRAQASANWSTTSTPGALYLQTTPSGSISPVDRWSIDQTGALSPVSPAYALVLPGPYANDSAAATAGVPVNGAYRVTGGAVAWRQV